MLTKRIEKYWASSEGKQNGESEYWDEFISSDTGKALTNTKRYIGESFED